VSGKCDVCGKVPQVGRHIRHKATGKWFRRAHVISRTFYPNVQRATLTINGVRKQMNVCTRCLRTAAKTK
jgi:large subunit ribosomal protein L28